MGMENINLLFKDEVYKIIGCAIEVYNELKNGYLEAVYQEAFEQMLLSYSIPYSREKDIVIYFHDKPLKKGYRADFILYDKILVEFKAKCAITDDDEAQILNYLKGTHLPVALLINFGNERKLEWRRYAMTKNYNVREEERESETLNEAIIEYYVK